MDNVINSFTELKTQWFSLNEFIKMLCNTPWPVQRWVDIRDGSVVE